MKYRFLATIRKAAYRDEYAGEDGFTLLEGMLAAVILGTGLLVLSAMQAMALVKNVDANELTRVTAVGADIMESIYFNRRNVGSYNGITAQLPPQSPICPMDPTAQYQAYGDCQLWQQHLAQLNLQNIVGTVQVFPATVLGQRKVTVTVTWMGSVNSASSVKRQRTVTLNRVVAPE